MNYLCANVVERVENAEYKMSAGPQTTEPFLSTDPNVLLFGLQEIRRRRRLMWIVFILVAPVVWLTDAVLGSGAVLYIVILWLGLFVMTKSRVHLSRCPRCGQRYHEKDWWHNPWARKCLHCKLELDAFEP